jgi:hypothetical protein
MISDSSINLAAEIQEFNSKENANIQMRNEATFNSRLKKELSLTTINSGWDNYHTSLGHS